MIFLNGTVFLFILICNISGLFGLRPPTADYGVTLPLGLVLIGLAESGGRGAAAALQGWQWLLLPAAGAVTALPLVFFSQGIRETPYTLAGVLMLVNPTLQLLIGVFCMDEAFTATHAILFAFVWTGLALFLIGNVMAARRGRQCKGDTICE